MLYQKLKVFPALLCADAIVKAEIAGRYVADKGLLLNQAVLEPRVFRIDELRLVAFDPAQNVAFLAVPERSRKLVLEVELSRYLNALGKSISELDSRLQPQEVEVFLADKKSDN